MNESYDFSGWATRANLRCSDGRTIMKDAFKDQDNNIVPLVWMHQHNDPNNVLGHALLKNKDEGVYAYCKFNDTEAGNTAKQLVEHGDVSALSIHATRLKQNAGDVVHGTITEVSLVLAGANPGACIDSIVCHSDGTDEEAIIYTGEDIVLAHSEDVESADEETTLEHAACKEKKPDKSKPDEGNDTKEEKTDMAEEPKKPETESKEKTVKEVFDTFTEEQKTVVYALIGQAIEDAKKSDDADDMDDMDDMDDEDEKKTMKHSEGGNYTMHNNVFDRDSEIEMNTLSHADQAEIIKNAKTIGSFKAAMESYVEDHASTLSHGIEGVEKLFPDYKDVYPGAPELLERDQSWVATVMNKAHKSPASRIRTRQADARAAEIRAKGYTKSKVNKKTVSGDIKLILRTTDPQTVYYRDTLHRDDVVDMDFDLVAYQRGIMKSGLEEEVALAALVGDGREVDSPDKINEANIRPIWTDDDVYTIKANVDIDGMKTKLQGTNTGANFGDEYIFTEAVIAAALYAREDYKGKGLPDFFCTPHTLNVMLLARDMNGRRIYDSAADLAKILNVGAIHTVEQMEGLTRTDKEEKEHELLGLFVNMSNYTFGCAKGGEITNFEDFDIDFNQYKYLMETRLSGALTSPYSAIALEKPVAAG